MAAEQGDDGYLDARIKFLQHQVCINYHKAIEFCDDVMILHVKIQTTREDQNQQREKETKLNNCTINISSVSLHFNS